MLGYSFCLPFEANLNFFVLLIKSQIYYRSQKGKYNLRGKVIELNAYIYFILNVKISLISRTDLM